MSLPGFLVDTSAGRVYVHRPSPGSGQPLVLVHGFMMSHWYFRPLLGPLAAEHDVVAIDLPGHGESDRPPPERFGYDFASFAGIVVEVMDRLGIPRAAVVGHSMGGGTALALAARRPERVERLVLMAAATYPLPMPAIGRLVLGPGGELLWRYAFRRADMLREMRRAHVKDARAITDDFIDHYWARFNRPGGRAAAYAALRSLGALAPNNPEPERVRAPTLVVWGDEDRVVPFAHGRRLARAIAGARLSVVPDTGHIFHLERPDESLRQLQPFLREPAVEPVAPPPARAIRAS